MTAPESSVALRIQTALATTARAARVQSLPADARRAVSHEVRNLSCRLASELHMLDEEMGHSSANDAQRRLLLYEIACLKEIIAAAQTTQRELLRQAKQQRVTDEEVAAVCGITRQAVSKRKLR